MTFQLMTTGKNHVSDVKKKMNKTMSTNNFYNFFIFITFYCLIV